MIWNCEQDFSFNISVFNAQFMLIGVNVAGVEVIFRVSVLFLIE